MPNSEAVIKPRMTAMIKSPIPIMFQTMTARLELYPFLKDYAKGIAVTPIKISPTPAGIPKVGCKIHYMSYSCTNISYPALLYIFQIEVVNNSLVLTTILN
ncbi:MAG: hypothetical protein WCA39_14820 [Nitrososphaeraceae archaeon]